MPKANRSKWILLTLFLGLSIFVVLYPFIYPPKIEQSKASDSSNYLGIPDFASYENVIARKKAFFTYLIPEIVNQNDVILSQRHWLLALQQKLKDADYQLSRREISELEKISQQYKVDASSKIETTLIELLNRVDIIPLELVLVQAANESAWGTSRFARQGYNFFGMWCFKPGCGFVPARRPEGAINEVAKFPDLAYAVKTYLTNLNRHPAYSELRLIRHNLRVNHQEITAEALVQGLSRYSERGQDYIEELLDMIRVNKKYMQTT